MNRRDVLIAGSLVLGLVALLVPFAPLGVDPHHDGIMLKPALDVLAGQVLFRDTFTQYGALTTYLQVMALLIEPSLLAIRFLTVTVYAVTLFFLYATWRLILPRSLALLSGGLYILFIPSYEKDWLNQYWTLLPWSSVFAMMFQSIGIYALFRLIAGGKAKHWGLLLGLACACVFWCRQPVGVIMAGCLAVIWPALHWTDWSPAGSSRRAALLWIIGGFMGTHALLMGGVLLSGAGPAWWYQNIVWPSKWVIGSVNVNLRAFTTVFVHPAAAAWLLVLLLAAALPRLARRYRANLSARLIPAYYLCLGLVLVSHHAWLLQVLALRDGGWTALLPIVVVLLAIISLGPVFVARRTPKTTEYYLVAALAALSLGSLLQYYPVPDSWHMLWALAPAFGLCVFGFWRWLAWPAPVLALALAAAFLPSVYAKARSAADCLNLPTVALTAPSVLRGMKVAPEEARTLGRITDTVGLILKHRPDIPSVMIGSDALMLCFTPNLTNSTPYYVNWENLADEQIHQQRWRYIRDVRPLMYFHKANWSAVGDFYRRGRYVPLLYLPKEALEIAIPQELADAMGLTAYGATPRGETTQPTSKP